MAHVHRLTPSPALIFSTIISLVVLIPGDFQSIVNYFRWCSRRRCRLLPEGQNPTWLLISFSASLPGSSTPSPCPDSSTSRLGNQSFPGPTGSVSHAPAQTHQDHHRFFQFSTFCSLLASTGAAGAAGAGHHCGGVPGAGAHHRQAPDRVPLRDFVRAERSDPLHPSHSLQALPRTADQADGVPAAAAGGGPRREEPLKVASV